jgi:arabinogalactan endo-1,4-beta-galactosidase
MAQTQLDKMVRALREPAYRYARRVMMLATAAAVTGEDIDLKAQRAFAKGINFHRA